jgi:zinc transport system ATP-binding protein
MKPAVSFDHVSFAYEDVPVLSNVSFLVGQGAFYGIIGPNGGGKTTLLKLIMGFLKPRSGFVSILGEPPSSVRSQIAYVPQTMRFDKQFPISVLEVVLQGRLSHLTWYGTYSSKDLEAARETMEKVGILDLQDRAFGTLSGGQAQRTLIARALVSNPSILLLDEPTASVDAKAQAEIYDFLRGLKDSMTILMVTHDLGIAIEKVEKIICVQNSVIMLTPQEVCEHFAMGLYHYPLIQTLNRTHKTNL